MRNQVGHIFLNGNNIVARFNAIQIESAAPKNLKEISEVKEFDVDGYFVLETNYGEEYLDLQYVLDELECEEIKLAEELSGIIKFEIGGVLQ